MKTYELIKADNNYLVINKTAGVITHRAPHVKQRALADDLEKDYPEIARVGDDPLRPGLVHRLDKLASGLMVVARSQAGFESLKKQFQERSVTKRYTALAYGRIETPEGEINFPIKRSASGHKMAALPLTAKGEKNIAGRYALTEFLVEKNFINYTLLKVTIKTGRTHQIRVHFSAYGHPLVGDDLYGTKKTKVKNAKLNLGRIFLVADCLEFSDLQGKRKNFTINLPSDLQNFLDILK